MASTMSSPAYRPLGGVFVRLGIAKVDEQAIAQVLRHVAIEGLDRRYRGLLVGAHHGPVVFRIKLLREARRVDQIAEHYRKLAAFGVRGCGVVARGALWTRWSGWASGGGAAGEVRVVDGSAGGAHQPTPALPRSSTASRLASMSSSLRASSWSSSRLNCTLRAR